MGFFDFLAEGGAYSEYGMRRLDLRKGYILDAFDADIAGARVLDLAAHDGRWSYALAAAGAREVVAIEARPELVARFEDFPDTPFKSHVDLRVGDLYDGLDDLTRAGESFDVVALYGIFYHVMDHMRILRQIRELGAGLVIIDSDFIVAQNAMIQLVRERTAKNINAAPLFEGQEKTLIGVPSVGAMEKMAEVLDYRCIWSDWSGVPRDQRRYVSDYFTDDRRRRMTCVLRRGR